MVGNPYHEDRVKLEEVTMMVMMTMMVGARVILLEEEVTEVDSPMMKEGGQQHRPNRHEHKTNRKQIDYYVNIYVARILVLECNHS